MMGCSVGGGAELFYSFSLDEKILADHLLRRIDQFLDFDEPHLYLKPFCSPSFSVPDIPLARNSGMTTESLVRSPRQRGR